MKQGFISKPRIKDIIIKTLTVTMPSMLFMIIGLFFLMYCIDKSVFTQTIDAEVQSLIKTANTYDGFDYTKTDLFYSRMKEALLSYAERCSSYHTYAVVSNYDNIVVVSSKEAFRAFMISNQENSGSYYYCENPKVLKWMREEWIPNLTSENMERTCSGFYLDDAYLYPNGLFIPGLFHKWSAVYGKVSDWGPSQIIEKDEIQRDFSELVNPKISPRHIYIEHPGNDSFHISLDENVRGTQINDAVFQYVDEKCQPIGHTKKLGDIETSYRIKLDHGSDSLVLFARMNVFQLFSARYLAVFLIVLSLTLLCSIVTVILRYQTAKNLYENELFRTTLINRLSHDLRTPLSAMVGYSENLLANIATEKKEHYARTILHNAEYMNEIIQNVMVLSKTENGALSLHKEPVDFMELSRDAWEKYKYQAEEKGLSICCQGECTMNADRFLICQMIENLMSNAVTHSAPGSQILINGTSDGYHIGNTCNQPLTLASEELWKPFVKENLARSSRTGSGIGLSIVKNICSLHGFKAEITYEKSLFKIDIMF